MKGTVQKVVGGVLEEEEEGDLEGDLLPGGERNLIRLETEVRGR